MVMGMGVFSFSAREKKRFKELSTHLFSFTASSLAEKKMAEQKSSTPMINEKQIRFREGLSFGISSKSIDLSGAGLDTLPEEIDIAGLEHLDLSRNQFTSICKYSFRRLNQLTTLNLSDNPQLWDLHGFFNGVYWFDHLKSLERLNLSRTHLFRLPIAPGLCQKLKELQVDSTKITRIPRHVIETLHRNKGTISARNCALVEPPQELLDQGASLDDVLQWYDRETTPLPKFLEELRNIPYDFAVGISYKWLSYEPKPNTDGKSSS